MNNTAVVDITEVLAYAEARSVDNPHNAYLKGIIDALRLAMGETPTSTPWKSFAREAGLDA